MSVRHGDASKQCNEAQQSIGRQRVSGSTRAFFRVAYPGYYVKT